MYMKKFKVAYVTSSRADYGIVRRYLHLLNSDDRIRFSVLVTGSHLEEKYGNTVDNIRADGFNIEAQIPIFMDSSSNATIIYSMSNALNLFGRFFEQNKYDLLIVLGDRYEMMAVAIAAAMQRIPILHLHGGEVTYGNYDEFIRHSITKMSQYHFTSTEDYRKRVIQLGEKPENVFYMGALGAENCCCLDVSKVDLRVKEIAEGKYWVVAFHPETLTNVKIEDQIVEVLSAIDMMRERARVVFIGTNADTHSDIIRTSWLKYVNEHDNTYYFENLNSDSFLHLLKNSLGLIGNSSSGIIEAPSLGCYTINIGDRQKGRVRGNSVSDVLCERESIRGAMLSVLNKYSSEEPIENPYYKGNTARMYYEKTVEILERGTGILKEFHDLR